jgi:hypothetical protein
MRERRPADRVTDLAGRHTLETTVARALADSATLPLTRAATASYTELDYTALGPGGRTVAIELKAKLQPYRGWDRHAPTIPAHDLFILDELALRKLIDAGRYAFLIVWDQPIGRWCVWSSLDLVLATKIRVARPLAGTGMVKAKVLLDLDAAAHTCTDLPAVIDAITDDVETCDTWWTSIAPWPYGPTVTNPYRRTS